MDPLLEITGLTVQMGRETILQDLTFQVHPGELLGLIGPNGAGKTTLLEALAGFIPIQHGRGVWKGRELPGRAWGDQLFYMPDGITPYAEHRVSEVIEAFRLFSVRDQGQVTSLVEGLNLNAALTKRVRELSKGNRKRLMLALAFLSRRELLLLDEPFDGLDLHQTLAAIDLLRSLRTEGRTFLFSIHELRHAERLCERFLLLREGRLIASGTLPELLAQSGTQDGLEGVFLAHR
jgi:ABC-2 type transport system ATP-binding protein